LIVFGAFYNPFQSDFSITLVLLCLPLIFFSEKLKNCCKSFVGGLATVPFCVKAKMKQ